MILCLFEACLFLIGMVYGKEEGLKVEAKRILTDIKRKSRVLDDLGPSPMSDTVKVSLLVIVILLALLVTSCYFYYNPLSCCKGRSKESLDKITEKSIDQQGNNDDKNTNNETNSSSTNSSPSKGKLKGKSTKNIFVPLPISPNSGNTMTQEYLDEKRKRSNSSTNDNNSLNDKLEQEMQVDGERKGSKERNETSFIRTVIDKNDASKSIMNPVFTSVEDKL